MDSTPASSPQQPGKPIVAKLGEANSFYYDTELKRWVNKKAGKEDQVMSGATPPPPKGPPRTNTAPPSTTGQGDGPPRSGSAPPMPPPMGMPTPMGGNFNGPPSAMQSRSSSPAMPPPGMLSRQDSGGLGANLAPPMLRSVSALSHGSDGSSTGPPSLAPPSAPQSAAPSRPGTGVLRTDSTIDDLLGPAAPRKRDGTLGKKKKGRGRYIDVMADQAGGGGGGGGA